MPPALLTAEQSRWVLSLLVGLLSAVAIVSSIPNLLESESILSGRPGDIRGVLVSIGLAGVISIFLSRLATLFLPKPWRVYIDRIEFAVFTMLWICWTSATMSFSAFTLGEGVCASTTYRFSLPTCPLLTFDMAILHLLSIATFAHLLVILSTVLSPTYYLSYSLLPDGSNSNKIDDSGYDGFVMWDLAVSSPPPSPRLNPIQPSGYTTTMYGTANSSTTPPVDGASPFAQTRSDVAGSSNGGTFTPVKRRDKFAEGRVWNYVLLLICSIGVLIAAAVMMGTGEFVTSCVIIIAIGSLSSSFAISFLRLHSLSDKLANSDRRSFLRALEVGCAMSLFVMWPLAAIAFTLFPSVPNRACTNPQSSEALPTDLDPKELEKFPFTDDSPVCILSMTVVTLAWVASWIMLARIIGLIFPMPQMDIPVINPERGENAGEEGRSLLRDPQSPNTSTATRDSQGVKGKNVRPQMGWGRIVAGEAFELGDEED